jgi:capsular exopolysaccharide synthesis family protein
MDELEVLRQEATLRRRQRDQLQRDVELQTVNALLAPTVATVVDPPHAVPYQTWNDRWRWFGAAVGIALLLSCGVALIAASNDSSLRAASAAPRLLRMMPLGDVPKIGGKPERQTASAGLGWMRSRKGPLRVFEAESESPEAQEAFRQIRTSVVLARPELPPQTLLVVSPRGKEGSSTVAVNLATGLAETGARTVLVDMNLRRPALAELFEVDNSQGMSEYLAGGGSMSQGISPTGRPDLFVLPAGRPPDDPAQLMSSKRAETGLGLLREYFGFIILDAPPVLRYSDVLALAPQVDGAIVVARAARTPAEDLREVRDLFVRLRIPILGLVVNGV